MSSAVKESFLEQHWQLFLIAFGIMLTLFFALYDPRVPGVPRTSQTDPKVMTERPRRMVRSGGD